MAFFRSIATIGAYTMASRVLGFVRDILIAAFLGAGPVADAFFVAFKLPNFFRRLFAEGAFNAAFVPMFAGLIATHGRAMARRFAEDAMAVLLVALFVFTVAAEFAMPWVLVVLAPGFADEPEKFQLAVEFTRVTFPYLLFISLVSLQGGVLNSLDRFAAVAATPILLNLTMIVGLLALVRLLPTAGHALAWSVAAAGITQFLWLAAACRRADMSLDLPRPRWSPEIKRLLQIMLPAALGSGVVQVNLMIDVVLASLLPTGAVSYLYYADRIYELPLAVIGIAIGTALLPLLSRQIRSGEHEHARATLNRALEVALLLTLPAAAALVALAGPIIAVLFERGAFGPTEVSATAWAVAGYGFGLPAFVLIKVLTPAFYARHDTATPVKIAVICVIVNSIAALALMLILRRYGIGHVGIVLATGLSAWVNTVMLSRGLLARGDLALDARLRERVPRMIAAAAIMGVALWFAVGAMESWLIAGTLVRTAALAGLVVLGLVVYGAAAQLLRASDLRDLWRMVGRARVPAAAPGE
jgi:putative peptidoglycan lipid II flippase